MKLRAMKNIKYKKILLLAILGVFVLSVNFCSADSGGSILKIPEPPEHEGTTLPVYLTWVLKFGIAIGFWSILIALTVSGGFFILSSGIPAMRAKAKEWLSGAITGFLIFTLLYLILTTIYPPLVLFEWKNEPLKTPTLPSGDDLIHGVYFYEGQGCKNTPYPSASNVPDFSSFTKNPIGSVRIVQDAELSIYHIAIIYSTQNYYGQCQYIDPNTSDCAETELTSSPKSASIYTYNWYPTGTVTFYRNGSFDKDGGYLTLNAPNIEMLYEKELKNLKFTGERLGSDNIEDCTAPEDQQDCKMWNKNGNCTKKECPTLSKKNISSIEIDGDYLVVLEYLKDSDMTEDGEPGEIGTFCQAYPKDQDVNKLGPKQIKWDAISNTLGFEPNYVLIIPIVRY